MDRFCLLGLLLSAGLHTAVVAHVGIPGAGGSDCSLPPGLELRYVEAVTRLSPAAATGEIETEALAALTVPAEEQVAAREPARPVASAMRGTGEVLRASVQETLRPLLDEGDSPDAEFSEAVCRYKARLEAILDRESRIAYPDPARMGGREARLQIRFSLRKDGSLESVELPPRCGGFEQELVAGLRKAARHFPAFPEEIDCVRLTFCWPVSFNLY